jgi:hypothetical protein
VLTASDLFRLALAALVRGDSPAPLSPEWIDAIAAAIDRAETERKTTEWHDLYRRMAAPSPQ